MNFSNHAANLIRLGLHITPIRGKAPFLPSWNKLHITEDEVEKYWGDGQYGVGVLCGVGDNPIVVLDCDIINSDLANYVHALLLERYGQDLVSRIGEAPKRAYFFRGANIFYRDTSHYDGSHIELLTKGQQVACYGYHPVTGRYTWPEKELFLIPSLNKLPEITNEVVSEIMLDFENMASLIGIERDQKKTQPPVGEFEGIQPPMGKSLKEIEQILDDIDTDKIDGNNYFDWLHVAMALHHETHGSDAGFQLFDKWSKNFPKYKGTEDCRKVWNSLGKHKDRRFITLRYLINRSVVKDLHDFSEDGMAKRMTDDYGKDIKRLDDIKEWAVFNQGLWSVLSDAFIEKLVKDRTAATEIEYFEKLRREEDEDKQKALYRSWKKLFTASMYTSVARNFRLDVLDNYKNFDKDTRFIGVLNGVVDTESWELLPTPDDERAARVTMTAHAKFDKDAQCPLWRQTIEEVFYRQADTGEMVKFIQRVFGAALLGMPEQKIFFHLGNGENGKSLVLNTLRKVLGEYSDTTPSNIIVSSFNNTNSSEGPSPYTADLKGKRFVVCDEVEKKSYLSEATVKRLTGGTDQIKARKLRQDPIGFESTFYLHVPCNYPPRFTGGDHGITRRVCYITYKECFKGRADKKRAKKLQEEYDGIFQWLIEGAKEYKRIGLVPPSFVLEETEENIMNQDALGNFILAFLEVTGNPAADFKTLQSDVREKYNEYAGREYALSAGTFADRLAEHRFIQEAGGLRRGKAHGNKSTFANVRIKEDEWKKFNDGSL